MKILLKTKEEIKIMKEGGERLRKILQRIIYEARPGVTTGKLDKLAEKLIEEQRGEPSFKMVDGYKWATCMCVNDCVVHGVPKERKLKANDVLGIDIGMYDQGFHTDTAWTIMVQGSIKVLKIKKFLDTGKLALERAIEAVRVENRVGHISKTIQETIEQGGYSVVRQLVGHGIGRKLHELPEVPCFLQGKVESTALLEEGMILAIEVIYTAGSNKLILDKNDGWTIRTKDGKISGLFEKTVAVTRHGPLVLT